MILTDIFARLTFGRALILGFTITALYYFMFFDGGDSQRQAAESTRAQIEQVKAEISGIQKKLDRAQEFQDATRELGQSIGKLLEFLPSGFRIGSFMKTVSTEARIAGLQIQRITPTSAVEGSTIPEFTELGVTVEVRGQFNQILKFMASLTQKKQIFVYKTLEIKQDANSGAQEGMITMSADIRAYDYIGATQNVSN